MGGSDFEYATFYMEDKNLTTKLVMVFLELNLSYTNLYIKYFDMSTPAGQML